MGSGQVDPPVAASRMRHRSACAARPPHSLRIVLADRVDVLVTAAAEAHEHYVVAAALCRQLCCHMQRVRSLESRNDSLEPRETVESREGLIVGGGHISHPD